MCWWRVADTLQMAKLMDKVKEFVAEKIVGIEKPSAYVVNVSIKNVNGDSMTLQAAVDVKNPYSHDLPIGKISYRILSADRVIVSGTILDPGSIMTKEKTRFNVPVKVPYNFSISIVRYLGKNWDLDYEWQIGLTMHIPIVGKFTLPIAREGTLTLPTISDIS